VFRLRYFPLEKTRGARKLKRETGENVYEGKEVLLMGGGSVMQGKRGKGTTRLLASDYSSILQQGGEGKGER